MAHGWAGGGEVMRKWLRRVSGEHGSLSGSLPLAWTSSVFVAADPSRLDILRSGQHPPALLGLLLDQCACYCTAVLASALPGLPMHCCAWAPGLPCFALHCYAETHWTQHWTNVSPFLIILKANGQADGQAKGQASCPWYIGR